jgi:hypothetical protein
LTALGVAAALVVPGLTGGSLPVMTSRRVRCSGMISFFSLRSEVTKAASVVQDPWRIPPSLSNVMDLPLPT